MKFTSKRHKKKNANEQNYVLFVAKQYRTFIYFFDLWHTSQYLLFIKRERGNIKKGPGSKSECNAEE